MMKFYLKGMEEGGRVERLLPGKVGYFNIKNLYYLEELISKGGREGERERKGKMYREKYVGHLKSKKNVSPYDLIFLIDFEDFSYLTRPSKPS